MQERDIKGEILAASFWENWNFAKELHKGKSPLAKKQFLEAEKIRTEWNNHQQSKHNEEANTSTIN